MKKYGICFLSVLSLFLSQQSFSMEVSGSVIEHPRFGILEPLSQEDFRRMSQEGNLEFRFYGVPHWTIILNEDDSFRKQYNENTKPPVKYDQLYQACLESALKKDTSSLAHLGILYYYEMGVRQDREEALELFREAADQGHAFSQYNTGVLLLSSHQDKSFELFEKAVAQGDKRAQYNLGLMCLGGYGCEINWPRAFKILSSLSFVDAKLYTALMSLIGLGTTQESSKAFKVLYQHSFHSVAGQILFQIYLKNHEKNLKAKVELAHFYLEGKGCPMNVLESTRLFEEAAAQGHANSYFQAAILYRKGDSSVPKDSQKALEFLKKGASLGDKECLFTLGKIYEGRNPGEIVNPNPRLATEFYYQAALRDKKDQEEKDIQSSPKFSDTIASLFQEGTLWCQDAARSMQWGFFEENYQEDSESDDERA